MRRSGLETAVAAARLALAALIVVAVAATFAATASRTAVNPFNFFGYFTVQSNLLGAAVLALTALLQPAPWLPVARACTTTYLVVVGLVYAVLLAPLGAAGGVPLPWANVVLHVVSPILVVVDWLAIGDRPPLRRRTVLLSLGYPLLWIAVVLVRGATDGWVPYPFLSPKQGYGVVALYVVAVAVVVAVVATLVVLASRTPGVLRERRARAAV